MKKERNSNIELLRIISIILIVISHYVVHGVGIENLNAMPLSITKVFLQALVLGNLGTILFVLISGYYLINSKEIKLKKIIKLILQVVFYSSVIYLCLILLHKEPFTFKNLIIAFFPITFKTYWFATAYIILYIFHPFINCFLNSLKQKEHNAFNMLLLLIFSVLYTITTKDYYGNQIIQFLLYYSLGAYLYKYPKNNFSKSNNKTFIILPAIILVLSIILFNLLNLNVYATWLFSRHSPIAILLCVSLFDRFTKKKEKHNKLLNTLGPLVFGVYLISDNEYLKYRLWINTLKVPNFIHSPYLILHIIFSISATIIICLLIEYIRKKLEEILFKRLDPKIDTLQDKLERKLFHKQKVNIT